MNIISSVPNKHIASATPIVHSDKHRPQEPLISIVVPMFNEEESIDLFFDRIMSVLGQLSSKFEIICVDDGSCDSTLALLRRWNDTDNRVKAISLSRNFGKELALTAGLREARGNVVIPIDVDLQDPPELIGEMIERWRAGADTVIAVRKDRSSDTVLKRVSAEWFYKFIGRIGEVPIPRNAGDYRLMDRQVVDALELLDERVRFNKGIFAWLGFDQEYVYFTREPRAAGTSKWQYGKLWTFALEGIFSFSTLPLKIWTYLGAITALSGLLYAAFIVTRTLIYGVDVPGYASVVVMVLVLNGITLTGLGIVGEYVGRIFIEAKKRPHFLIKRRIGFD